MNKSSSLNKRNTLLVLQQIPQHFQGAILNIGQIGWAEKIFWRKPESEFPLLSSPGSGKKWRLLPFYTVPFFN
jgi:hypothetical protein